MSLSKPPLPRHHHHHLIACSNDIYGESNFPQGCSFSPDGLCILTCTSADHTLRLYNTPTLIPLSSSSHESDSNDNSENVNVPCPNHGTNCSLSNNSSTGKDTTQQEQQVQNRTSNETTNRKQMNWNAVLTSFQGESVRSYEWYPLMNSYDPTTCAFISVSRDQPIHLIDAYTSQIRASYRPYNSLDELESPTIATFTPDGSRIFASGFHTDRTIHIFHTAIPGRESDVLRLGKTKHSRDGQKGLVSALGFPDGGGGGGGGVFTPNVFGVGTYSPGSIYIYDDRRPSGGSGGENGSVGSILYSGVCVVGHGKRFRRKKRRFVDHLLSSSSSLNQNEEEDDDDNDQQEEDNEWDIFSKAKIKWYQNQCRGGITQLTFSQPYTSSDSEFILYSASRHSNAIIGWDLRMLTGRTDVPPICGCKCFGREGDTNQRLGFELGDDGQSMYVASMDHMVKVYDVKSGVLKYVLDDFDSVVNGVSLSKGGAVGGSDLLAVSVGARQFNECYDESDSDGGDGVVKSKMDPTFSIPGSLQLYCL